MNILSVAINWIVTKFDIKNRRQEEKIKYLENECSELRQIVRFLQVDSKAWNEFMAQTRQSFDTQWEQLPDGKGLVTDSEFIEQGTNLVEKYTLLNRDWFKGKKVLDAGCGNGRWSYVLSSMGAYVTAVDQSIHGLKNAQNLCSSYMNFSSAQVNLLEPLPKEMGQFDLVWSFGVLHHTGNTYQSFKNIAHLVKPKGIIFLMLYGEPTNYGEYTEVNDYVFHRREISSMNFKDKIIYCQKTFAPDLVHGWFDAISPRINDLYRFDEIKDWLVIAGFSNIQRSFENRNLFIVAEKI